MDTCTIGLLLGLRTPFFLTIQKGAETEAARQNVALLVDAPADWDASLQIPLIDSFIERHVDALIVTPCDSQALVEPLRRAHEAGIKVLTVDAHIGDGTSTNGFPLTFIGSDNTAGGRLAGELLLRLLNGQTKPKVYIQSLHPGVSATDQREEGCIEILRTSDIELLGIEYDGGSIDVACEQATAMLQRHPDLAAIMSTGDYSSKGVARALRATNRAQDIRVVRFDASEQGIDELRAGVADVVIAQRPFDMGQLAVKCAVKAVKGEESTIPERISTGFVIIDRENVETEEAQAVICKEPEINQ
ncbi:ribose transport system substrate-binding protein [Thermosporothrix hazakensis]|jgi:ribose transport system substrate-binding protein|uniref:Ribose transport system substrate-binding protein n=2 Tax=Thermosporothrix TaxID=768650 RepID=A0A326UFF1_THEHA|nr:ABC transporter substrate-binding protein [Thermosporothrix hazakensis]PZW36744.1 ribose transport system substrate-binding protein [Thermosporothrix hazakensis]BBH89212.1 LacI family transcriptional regulator [Thermosporothrix sp. COM3]GCE47394.1 LacI family transcriptional regulator [Thermosporothrix hazakensis]